MHLNTNTHKQTRKLKQRKSKSKKAKAQTEILPLQNKHLLWVNANQTCGQSSRTVWLLGSISNDNRGRHEKVEGNEADRRDEQKGGQKDGMNSEPSWVIFIVMPLCEMRSSFSAVVLASYLAVHEFKVDSFQCDLQKSSFTSFHVLDGELSAQLRTWRKPHGDHTVYKS